MQLLCILILSYSCQYFQAQRVLNPQLRLQLNANISVFVFMILSVRLDSGCGHSERTDTTQRFDRLSWTRFHSLTKAPVAVASQTQVESYYPLCDPTHTPVCPYEDSHMVWRFASEVRCDFLPKTNFYPLLHVPNHPSFKKITLLKSFCVEFLSVWRKHTSDVWRTEPKTR